LKTLESSGKLYYSIGEVARMFEVNASLIRFWEKEFDLIKPHKNKKGNRLFTQQDIKNFKLIFHLVKEKGFTLQGAKDSLKSANKELNSAQEALQRLMRLREELVQFKNELE
jgi:DNA-binding transcriptional MerR regulator